jgi:rod shape-determining protein MreC
MRSLIQFILKYQNLMLFLILELAALILVINNNSYHNAKFHTWSLSAMGEVYENQSRFQNYFSLRFTNEELAAENAILKELLIKGSSSSNTAFLSLQDPLADKDIEIIPAKVVSSSVNKQHNMFTINIGTKDSIGLDMAVISPSGVVGVVKSVSQNYALVLPLINVENRISSKLKNSDYFGSLNWDTNDYKFASLEGIEHHVNISIGDSIVTSGYGAIFPEGIMVGTVEAINEGREGVFHDLLINLSTDFRRTAYVYVIKNNTRTERLNIEKVKK